MAAAWGPRLVPKELALKLALHLTTHPSQSPHPLPVSSILAATTLPQVTMRTRTRASLRSTVVD